MSLHLPLSTLHCPLSHFSHLLILVVPQIVIYHIYTYIIKSRVHMQYFVFLVALLFPSSPPFKILHQRENIRYLPFWDIFILQLNKSPLCVYIQLQPFICWWTSRLVSLKTSGVSLLPSLTPSAGSPSYGEGESGWPLVFRDLPSCPASMPGAQCFLLLPSVQICYLYFPSLVFLFSITFLTSFVCLIWSQLLTQASWETLETTPLLYTFAIFMKRYMRWGRIWATWYVFNYCSNW